MHELCNIFKALADETRLEILRFLNDNDEHCVLEIAHYLVLSQTRASRNLGILRDAGLLTDERRGTCIYYKVDEETHARLSEFLKEVFDTLPAAAKNTVNCFANK